MPAVGAAHPSYSLPRTSHALLSQPFEPQHFGLADTPHRLRWNRLIKALIHIGRIKHLIIKLVHSCAPLWFEFVWLIF